MTRSMVSCHQDATQHPPTTEIETAMAKKSYPVKDHSELLAQLSAGIESLTTSEQWTAYLDSQARFHNYSFQNCLLIVMQRPDATQVAGFHTWKALGRSVVKGEKALYVNAPMIYKAKDADTGEDSSRVGGFKLVPVFDLAQTEGDELPSNCVGRLSGDDSEGIYGQLVAVAEGIGFSVTDHDFRASGINGDCSPREQAIRIEVANSPAQRVKTLAHELGHALLHGVGNTLDRNVKELEAESVAYVVCQSLGMDTSGYSFGYVANWTGGNAERASAGIKASGQRIATAAKAILKAVESAEVERELVSA